MVRFFRYTPEDEENILNKVKKYLEEALQGEEELRNRYRKLILEVDNEDFIIFEKLRKGKHRTIFFRELLEAYYIIHYLKENIYENNYVIVLKRAVRNNANRLNGIGEDKEREEAIKENIRFLRRKILDEIEFWLEEAYKQSKILKEKSKSADIWKI